MHATPTATQATLSIANPVSFGMLYTFGNILSLFSTGFLVGPARQCKNMFHRKRVVATLIFLIALAATLGVAIGTKSMLLTLIMIVIQFCALVWYTLVRAAGVWRRPARVPVVPSHLPSSLACIPGTAVGVG